MKFIRFCLFILALANIYYVTPALAEKRAVLIGFSKYGWSELPGVRSDMALIKPLLENEYKITLIDDEASTVKKFRTRWNEFLDTIEEGDQILIFYSGHAIEVDGANYLLPLDAEEPTGTTRLRVLAHDFIKLRDLIEDVQQYNPAQTIFVINACRDNPYKTRGVNSSNGLRPEIIERFGGYTLIFFSADYGQAAFDSIPNQPSDFGSPFAHAFSKWYDRGKGLPIMAYFQIVSGTVQEMMKPRDQLPTLQGMVPYQSCLSTCKSSLDSLVYYTPLDASRETAQRIVLPSQVNILMRNQFSSLTKDQINKFTHRSEGVFTTNNPPATTDAISEKPENVVFIGKKSVADCTGNSVTEDMPFGCAYLQKAMSVSAADGYAQPVEIMNATALSDINVRKKSVEVRDGKGYYGCRVKVLEKGQTVKFKAISAIQYAKDVFLWGIVDAPPLQKCV